MFKRAAALNAGKFRTIYYNRFVIGIRGFTVVYGKPLSTDPDDFFGKHSVAAAYHIGMGFRPSRREVADFIRPDQLSSMVRIVTSPHHRSLLRRSL